MTLSPYIKIMEISCSEGTIRIKVKNTDRHQFHTVFFKLRFEKRTSSGGLALPVRNSYVGHYLRSPSVIEAGTTTTIRDDIRCDEIAHTRITNMVEDGIEYPMNTALRSGCFVATAVYRDANHPRVQEFRNFRDEVLARTQTGNKFINWYYRNGPILASIVERVPGLRITARSILTPAAHSLKVLRKSGLMTRHRPSERPRS